MTKPSILIFGGSGFVGSHLARHMVDIFNIKIFDARPPATDLKDKVDFLEGDIRDFTSVHKAVENVDLVIHTAIIGIPLINEEKRLGYEVNVLGTQNVCESVIRSKSTKGMILSGTWHIFGERDLGRVIDEEFGCRPDKVEERARFYALSKTVQENIVRLYDESSDKIYGIIRLGTVLGEGMPEKTAANVFISNALIGKPITPFKHSMYRPMLYVDVLDVCMGVQAYIDKILNDDVGDRRNSLSHIVNFAWPKSITILQLAETIKDCVAKCSEGRISPTIEIIDTGQQESSSSAESKLTRLDLQKASKFLGVSRLKSPKKAIERLVRMRMAH
jgi:nucleoside-diphosphate-sugar epimerase